MLWTKMAAFMKEAMNAAVPTDICVDSGGSPGTRPPPIIKMGQNPFFENTRGFLSIFLKFVWPPTIFMTSLRLCPQSATFSNQDLSALLLSHKRLIQNEKLLSRITEITLTGRHLLFDSSGSKSQRKRRTLSSRIANYFGIVESGERNNHLDIIWPRMIGY